MENIPDRWVVLDIAAKGKTTRKVFAGWYGGYLGRDSWKLNSGNMEEEEFPDRWEFTGASGSIYICHKASYGTSSQMTSLLESWRGKLQLGESIEIVNKYEPVTRPA